MTERTTSICCAEPGCKEHTFYAYTSQREYRDIWARQNARPWKCTRHDNPEQVLRPDNPTRTAVLVATRLTRRGEPIRGLYWVPPEGSTGSGFAYGPGFKAHADDFPEGTRLILDVRIETP